MQKIIIISVSGIIFSFAQDIHIVVDSTAQSYTLWTQMHESIGYSQSADMIQIVNRGFVSSGELKLTQAPGDLSFFTNEIIYYQQLGPARYPTSVAGTRAYISFPALIDGTGARMVAQATGWLPSQYGDPVDIGPGNLKVHKVIGKELPNGAILFIGITTNNSIIYRTWDSTLTHQIGSGIIADSVYYWGFDVNGGIAYIFYSDLLNDTLIYYKTTTDGIDWGIEQTWSLAFTPPYANTDIRWRQMALTDNGEPRLVFNAVDGDDSEYPWYGKVYVSHTSDMPPVQVSSSFASPDTECFYPTIATGGDYCVVLYCMPRNNEPDLLNWWDFYVNWSTDNGITWGQPRNCTAGLDYNPGLPQLAKRIDVSRFRTYYVYCASISNNNDPYAEIMWGSPTSQRIYLGCSPYLGIEDNSKTQKLRGEKLRLEVLPNIIMLNGRFECVIPERQRISLSLYDITGRRILVIAEGILEAGIYAYDFNSSDLSQGTYFLVLEGTKEMQMQKIIIIK